MSVIPPNIKELHNRASVYGSYDTTPREHNASFDGIYSGVVQLESLTFLSGAQVRAYIKMVLDDRSFLAGPKKYVTDWKERGAREHSVQFDALVFFIKNWGLL